MKVAIGDFASKVDPLKFFVITAAIFGMAFLLITPPFQGADEAVHYLRAYQISQGDFITTKGSGGQVGGYLPISTARIIDVTDKPSIQFYPQLKYDEHKTRAALSVGTGSKKSFYQLTAAAIYPPTAYPVSSFGILLSRLLHLPVLVSLYAARFGNLLTWIALVGAAIYLLPSRKWALAAVGLLPMFIFQAATINGDPVTFGSLAFLLALILKLRHDRTRVSIPIALLLLATAAIMVLSKNIMFVFLPLILLLRADNFSSSVWRAWTVKAAVIGVPLLLFGAWLLANHGMPGTYAYDNKQNPGQQFHFILSSPHSYINVLWNTYFYTWGDNITRSFIGTFGWSDAPLSEGLTVIGYISLFVLLVGSYERRFTEMISARGKRLLLGIAVVYWLAVSTALYMYNSPVGFKIVYGLQGRYYIPLALLAIPIIRSRKIMVDPTLYKRVAVLAPLFLLAASTITLYVRYFIHNV